MTESLTPEQEKARKITKKNVINAVIKKSPMDQNPVVKHISGALGIVDPEILKLISFNR